MKIIFLDIDGVINSLRTCYAFGGYPTDLSEEDMSKFDWVAISLIRKACKVQNAQIVLSSTWRRMYKIEDVAEALGLPIVSRTPCLLSGSRGNEIQNWLNDNLVDKYCIIDDDADMLDVQKPYFIQTSAKEGFILRDYRKLIEILGD